MIDPIKFRKIRYDVIDYLEQTDFIVKIESFIENKSKYADNFDYAQELLRKANLDSSLTNIDDIVILLKKYLDEYNDVNSINHSSILDYAQAVEIELIESEDGVGLKNAEESLENFIFQMVQIQKLQSKLLSSAPDIMYIDDDGNIYDRISDEKIFDKKDYTKDDSSALEQSNEERAMRFIADILIDNQRKLASTLEFDEEGFYLKGDGSELFDKQDKEEITEEVRNWLKMLYRNDEKDKSETVNEIRDLEIDDDVSITKTEMKSESKERMDRLKNILKDSSNKINKL